MRRTLIGMSLGLVVAIAPALPAAGQTWLPSWGRMTGRKPSAAPVATAPAPTAANAYAANAYAPNGGSPSNYGPATYSPSPYVQSPYGPSPYAPSSAMQASGAQQAGGPSFSGPGFPGGASPAAFQGASVPAATPPQVDLGVPSNYRAPTGVMPTPTPYPTLAPPASTPLPPVSTYVGPPTSAAALDATASRFAPPSPSYGPPSYGPQTYPSPPAPGTGPGINSSSTSRSTFGSLPGYGGGRSGINYGTMNSPIPEGPGTFEPNSAYGPSYAPPGAYSPSEAYPPYGGSPGTISSCAPPLRWYEELTAFYNYSAFKGPLDLDGLNGNFGSRVGVFGAVPVYAPLGIAAQVGSSYGWYDWKGTLFTGDHDRQQNFNTAGLFQRTSFGLNWGATYDWLLDDYYADFHFEQVRGAVSFNLNPCNEIGVWAAVPTRKDSANIGTPAVNNTFEPVLQGNLFWRKVWDNLATTNTFVGWCEEPSDFSYGTSAQFPLNDLLAVNGGFQYIWPGSGSNTGREEEIWTVSLGLVFYPGSAKSSATSPFRPLLAMPDNGNFAIRRH